MKKIIKRIVFAAIIVSLVLATGVVIKAGKFEELEGYMYSLATEITVSATDCNATSSNAQGCATSSNATSSNAQGCATSSNATSSNATSSNAQTTEQIKVTNTQTNTNTKTSTQTNTDTKEVVEKDLTYNNSEITQDIFEKPANSIETQSSTINLDNNETTSGNAEVKNEVSFLESHKMYIMIIGVSVLAIIIVAIILIVDKRAIAKRKAKANNNEEK